MCSQNNEIGKCPDSCYDSNYAKGCTWTCCIYVRLSRRKVNSCAGKRVVREIVHSTGIKSNIYDMFAFGSVTGFKEAL